MGTVQLGLDTFKGLLSKNVRGIDWNLSILRVDRNPCKFYLMFLSPEIDINCVNFIQNERGIGWNQSILEVDRNPCEFYMMFLSSEIHIKLRQIYTKISIHQMLYKTSRFKQIIFSKYATNLKVKISQRSISYLGLLLLYYYSHQWECSILVMWYRRRHMTIILHCHWWEFWSCDTDI